MRIAVFSDTHNRYPPTLPALFRAADELWHLGDVCDPEVLAGFIQPGRPLRVVRGNNDYLAAWPLELWCEAGGRRFFLTHIAPRRAPLGAAAVLHGHTHTPRDETDAHGVRWLNPGCVSRPNRGAPPSFAWLTAEAGRPLRWDLVLL